MTLLTLIGVAAIAACVAAQGANFVDYDYQDSLPPQRPSQPAQRPQRPQQSFGPIRTTGPTVPRPTPVPILKQINRLDSTKRSALYSGALLFNSLPRRVKVLESRKELKKQLTDELMLACPYSVKEFMERR